MVTRDGGETPMPATLPPTLREQVLREMSRATQAIRTSDLGPDTMAALRAADVAHLPAD